ncbi:unnamed protein product [Didymodactylos carnosus]|uniref:Kinesin light chain n=1 Tax=Didymodactylos carnosus TaxID=1234261 RepID=A0A815IJ02_9BILA|nr:unnamed protein product [Didymodactylos carnosus]CAF1366594.1 unnamed protein product [Didymodactylos carnosus]CAF4013564.1 unnamed protein product [Didymodactylos carnosus]CAF4249356.1 unnamed protein product [Didymodactylos carnosus]
MSGEDKDEAEGVVCRSIINYEKALTVQKEQLPSDHPDIARTLFNMGHCYVALTNYDQGLKLMTEALEICRKSLPSNHSDLALTYSSLGSLYVILKQNELALEYFVKASEIHYAAGKPDKRDLWITETSIRRTFS